MRVRAGQRAQPTLSKRAHLVSLKKSESTGGWLGFLQVVARRVPVTGQGHCVLDIALGLLLHVIVALALLRLCRQRQT